MTSPDSSARRPRLRGLGIILWGAMVPRDPGLRRFYLACHGGLVVLAGILAFVPLVNILAFEFCLAMAVVVPLLAGLLGAREAAVASPGSALSGVLARALGRGLALLVPPLILISLNGFRVRNCDPWEGLGLYLAIAVTGGLHGAAMGVALGVLAGGRRAWRGSLAFVAMWLASLIWSLLPLVITPVVYAYNPYFGYFPGPLYDNVVELHGPFLWAKAQSLLLLAGLLALAGVRRRLVSAPPWLPYLAPLFLAGALALAMVAPRLGVRMSPGSIEAILGGRHSTPHLDMVYEEGSMSEKEIEMMARDHEFRWTQVSRFFAMDHPPRVTSFVFSSPEQKLRLMGARNTSIAKPWHRQLYINRMGFPHLVVKHELVHAMLYGEGSRPLGLPSRNLWSVYMGLVEGAAVAGDWSQGALTPHQWTRAMEILGIAPDIKAILSTSGFWSQSHNQAYTLAGSFVRHLIDTRGPQAFKALYKDGDFQAAYGQGLDSLVAEWRAFLTTIEVGETELQIAKYRYKKPSIFRKVCAHEVAQLCHEGAQGLARGQPLAAAGFFLKAFAFDDSDPAPLMSAVDSYMASGQDGSVMALAQQILAHPSTDAVLQARALERLGDSLWRLSRPAWAAELYRKALNLHVADTLDRRVAIKMTASRSVPGATKDLEPGAVMMNFLLMARQNPSLEPLIEAAERYPHLASLQYLYGRQLFLAQRYEEAARFLGRAQNLPDSSLEVERERLLAYGAYYLRNLEEGAERFRGIARMDIAEGLRNEALDWAERCDWERTVWSRANLAGVQAHP